MEIVISPASLILSVSIALACGFAGYTYGLRRGKATEDSIHQASLIFAKSEYVRGRLEQQMLYKQAWDSLFAQADDTA